MNKPVIYENPKYRGRQLTNCINLVVVDPELEKRVQLNKQECLKRRERKGK